MTKEELFEQIRNKMKAVRLIPFNWELANYSNLNPESEDWDKFDGFSLLGEDHLFRTFQFIKSIPIEVKSDILIKYRPAFIVPMGVDTVTESKGGIAVDSTLWESNPGATFPWNNMKIQIFNTNCILINQWAPGDNMSFGLIPIEKYRLAQFLSIDILQWRLFQENRFSIPMEDYAFNEFNLKFDK